ncbi:phosphopantothenate--cysteine ligase isoform X1 [Paramuricea clavata]|nr:phosphopantothenate--cysteine ligase isoform X1 [Paramuricea clavata]
MSAETLSAFGHRVMFYLAAAVSDFYIPRENLSTHKIQSSQGPLVLNLQQTPKLLQPLVKDWSPQAFVVSFKLETDVNIISKKARESLNKNSHQVVISNILQTRRKTVVIVTANEENAIWMSDSELEQGKDIEEKIVADLVKKHSEFIRNNSLPGYNSSNEFSLDKSFPITTTSGQVIYLSEGTTYQLQGRVAENPASTILLSPNQTQQFTMPNSYGARKPTEDNTASRPLQTEVSELDTLSTTATNLASKFKFSYDNTALSEDMKAFIEMFKNKRMTLGYTQEDVGVELSQSSGPTYSQSFISRFESKQLAAKASEKMRPILQAWLDAKDVDQTTGLRLCKKRRRRTSFTSDSLAVLVENYQKNPKPNTSEIAEIAGQLNIEPVTVKVWFCNRKQSERRRSQGRTKTSETLKSELEARSVGKEQEKSGGEQIASYSLERLQPLIAEQAATPVTVLDSDSSHIVQYQTGVTVTTHDDNNASLTQNTSQPYSSHVTVMDTDPNVVQYQPGTTPDANSTALNQATPYTAPVAVMETEVPTSDAVQSTPVV